MSEHREPIPSMLYNAAVGGHVTNSQQIIDENINREQSDVNQEVLFGEPYNSTTPNGMGRIILKKTDNFKNVVEAQSGNTIFVIKYDFTLSGDVTVPANCILEFDGGSISGNGTITCNGAMFKKDVKLNNVIFTDSCGNDEVFTSWFFSINTLIFKNIVEIFGRGKQININTNISIDNSTISQERENIIDLYSNTIIKGDNSHVITVYNNNIHYGMNAVFGNANINSDINNISIENVNLILDGYTAFSHSLAFVELSKYDASVESHVNNILIKNCKTTNAACLVYVLKTRTTSTLDRTVNNLTIEDCKAVNVTWSGCTLDGKNVLLRNCYFYGDNSDSYDGISIHSGIDVVVDNCVFEHFTNSGGIACDIRNSPENLCGTSNITVKDCVFKDFPNSKAGQIATVKTDDVEPGYGVSDIRIINNIFTNCQGFAVTSSVDVTHNPKNISICGNTITGIHCSVSNNVRIENLSVQNNIVSGSFNFAGCKHAMISNNICTLKSGSLRGIRYYCSYFVYSGNVIENESNNDADDAFEISLLYYSKVSNNSFATKVTINGPYNCTFATNTFYKAAQITFDQAGISKSIINGNLFITDINTFNGRAFVDLELKVDKTKVLYTSSDATVAYYNKVGDIIINENSVDKPIQRCIETGTPGIFKTIAYNS